VRDRTEALRQADRRKDQFLAVLGHELRNPLAAIATAAQVLEQSEQTQRKDVEQHAKAIIRRQVRHLGKLTDDLLDAARVMMGKIVLDRRPVDLAQVVGNTVDTLRNTGQLQRHECGTELESVWVNVDPTVKDRQFCDGGTQYRTSIFYHDDAQRKAAEASKAQVEKSKPFKEPIVTPIELATTFYPAEDYHQDYYVKNPVRCNFYRTGWGRDARLKELWGAKAGK